MKPSDDLLAETPERHETGANSYRGKVELYYPKSLPATPENEMYLAVAQIRDRSNLAEGIPRLVAALAAVQPKTPEPYLDLASAYQAAGQLDRAIATYREALQVDPQYSVALLGLGSALRQSGQLSPAADAFEQATHAVPENPKAWNELGQVDIDLGRAPQALEALKKSIAWPPKRRSRTTDWVCIAQECRLRPPKPSSAKRSAFTPTMAKPTAIWRASSILNDVDLKQAFTNSTCRSHLAR